MYRDVHKKRQEHNRLYCTLATEIHDMSGIPAKIADDLQAEGTTIIAPAIINPYKQQKRLN